MQPSGKAGKEYTDECTCLILEWVNDSQPQSTIVTKSFGKESFGHIFKVSINYFGQNLKSCSVLFLVN